MADGNTDKAMDLLLTANTISVHAGREKDGAVKSDTPSRNGSVVPGKGTVSGATVASAMTSAVAADDGRTAVLRNDPHLPVNVHIPRAMEKEKKLAAEHIAHFQAANTTALHDAMVQYNLNTLKQQKLLMNMSGSANTNDLDMMESDADKPGITHFKKAVELLNTIITLMKEERGHSNEQISQIPTTILHDCATPDTSLSVLVAFSCMALSSVEVNLSNLMFVDGKLSISLYL